MTDKKIKFENFEIVKYLKNNIDSFVKTENYRQLKNYSDILYSLYLYYGIRNKIKYIPKDFYIVCKNELIGNIYLLDSFINKLNLKIAE